MEIENALYESRYIEDWDSIKNGAINLGKGAANIVQKITPWNTINNIAQNGIGDGIKKTAQDFVQKQADNKNKKAADKALEAASKDFMTDREWQTFVNSVGTIIQNNKKKLSPKNSSNKNVTKEVDKTNNVTSTEAGVQPPEGEAGNV